MKRLIYLGLFLAAATTGCGSSSTPADGGDLGTLDVITQVDVQDAVATDVTADTRDVAAQDVPVGNDVAADVAFDLPGDLPADVPVPDATTDADPDVIPADIQQDAPADVPTDVAYDVIGCQTWRLVEAETQSVNVADPVAFNVGRTARLQLQVVQKCNQRRAMSDVVVDQGAKTVSVRPRVWEQVGLECAGADLLDVRIITFSPAAAGSWNVSVPDTDLNLPFTVNPAPGTGCSGPVACDEDCDCETGVCLGGNGIAGPFTACAYSCEMNADCPTMSFCGSAMDGLMNYCQAGVQLCSSKTDCDTGFTCSSATCVPDYTLNQSTRHECNCDADCDAPLHCVEPADPKGVRRCEFMCPTGGNWCAPAHFCWPANMDISGLAATDSVCGWIGE